MERLAEMMVFARVVEQRSFSAAAQALGTSKSVVSKQISNLEAALGVRLLNRTTRQMSLTEVGAAYYEHCVRIAQELEAAGQTIAQLQAEPRGVLRLTAPVIFSSLHLAPALHSFLARHDKVEIELNAVDRLIDMVEEGYDVAIRITSQPPPNMVARKIADVRWATCAAPSYIECFGAPAVPQDLAQHRCLIHYGIAALRGGPWRYRVGTREVAVRVNSNVRVNNSEVLLQMALEGAGIVLFPTYIVGRYLKSGQLVELLKDSVANPGMELVASYFPNRYMQPKVRAFINHLLEHFGPHPWWDQW